MFHDSEPSFKRPHECSKSLLTPSWVGNISVAVAQRLIPATGSVGGYSSVSPQQSTQEVPLLSGLGSVDCNSPVSTNHKHRVLHGHQKALLELLSRFFLLLLAELKESLSVVFWQKTVVYS